MEPYIAPTRKKAKATARRLVLNRAGSKLDRPQARFFTESVLKGACNCGQCEYFMCVFTPVRSQSQVAMVRWCRWCGREDKAQGAEPTPEQGIEVTDDLIDVAPDMLEPTEESPFEPSEPSEQAFPDLLEPTEEDIFQALERRLNNR